MLPIESHIIAQYIALMGNSMLKSHCCLDLAKIAFAQTMSLFSTCQKGRAQAGEVTLNTRQTTAWNLKMKRGK